ncbi:MAG TPA: hypothetical protein VIP52_12270 [Candidatus Dormibacteraeota bacterium]|jgi:hypothetical protein
MEQQSVPDSWPERRPSPGELRKLKTALRQVEWADTYLLAFANLELSDFELNRAVDDIRLRLVTAELRLRRLIAS